MKADPAAAFGRSVQRFFQDYLPQLRGMSIHTIKSYRDALILFLRFTCDDTGKPVEKIQVGDLNHDRVMRFLQHLEDVRRNTIATRNVRLAALHTFVRFLAAENPESLSDMQAVLGIPFKRGERTESIDYFERDEMSSFLQIIDRDTPSGARDYVLFAVLFNTGARVQEVLNLRVCVMFALIHPIKFDYTGKGIKSDYAQFGQALLS